MIGGVRTTLKRRYAWLLNAARSMLPEMKHSLREAWSPPGAGPQVEGVVHIQPGSPAAVVELVGFLVYDIPYDTGKG